MDGFLPWIGGKHRLSGRIARIIDRAPHTCYLEPFMGAAHVFFRRESRPKAEVLNDANRELVTLFRVLQWHLVAFLEHFKWALVSRDEFQRQLRAPPDALTDIQRAARFYYVQKLGFGGKVKGRTFGTSTTTRPHINLVRMEEELSAVHLRLTGVTVECLPWADAIARYDRRHTLIYLDPPYWGSEDDYGRGLFPRSEYAKLAEVLGRAKATWLLSLNDVPEVRRLFQGFPMAEARVKYTVNRDKTDVGQAAELLIGSPGLDLS